MEDRFQVLPLEGLVSFKTGKLNSNAAKPEGMFPFFTCSQETFSTDTWSFDGEYVLLAGNNAAGIYPLKYFNGKFDAYQRTYAIKTIDENVLVTRYVYYALRLQLELMKSISTGVATKFLTLSLLNRTQIPIPPPSNTAENRHRPLRLRRSDREQPAANQDSGGDDAEPLPRVVRQVPLPRPPARQLCRFLPWTDSGRVGSSGFGKRLQSNY